MDVVEKEIHFYQTREGKIPFQEWRDALEDQRNRDCLLGRLSETIMKPSVPYKELLMNELQDPQEALGYLQAALEDPDPRVFLVALRDVVQAQCGMSKLSHHAKMSREHLYDVLSKRGNPGLITLHTILSTLGYRLSIERNRNLKKAA